MTKKNMLTDRFSATVHLHKPPINSSSENPNLPLIGENIIIFSIKTFLKCSYLKKIRITNSIFLVHFWKELQDLCGLAGVIYGHLS